MTSVLTGRGNLDTDVDRWKTREEMEKTAISIFLDGEEGHFPLQAKESSLEWILPPEPSEATNPACRLNLRLPASRAMRKLMSVL